MASCSALTISSEGKFVSKPKFDCKAPPQPEKNQTVSESKHAVSEKNQTVSESKQAVVAKKQAVVERKQAVVAKKQAVVESKQAVVAKKQAVSEKVTVSVRVRVRVRVNVRVRVWLRARLRPNRRVMLRQAVITLPHRESGHHPASPKVSDHDRVQAATKVQAQARS